MKDTSIYIVIAVLSIILVGIGVFLITMDRKVKKLENQISDHEGKK